MVSEKERIRLEYLVLHCQHRDRKAWEQLVHLYERRLFYYIKQMVGQYQDALNVMQDTWIKAYYSIHQLRQPASLTSWLYQIARNMSVKCLRCRRQEISFEACLETNFPVYEEEISDSYAAEQIHLGLKQLTLPHRESLVLYYLEDFSLREIAEILSVPIGTVRSRLYYAKRSLKAILEKENKDEYKSGTS